MFSTSGGIQYIGEYIEGYHEYIEGCLVHRRDIMMHWGGNYDACGRYQEYIRGCWLDTMSTAGDIMSTSGDVQYIGRISWCMWGSKLIKSFKFLLKTPMYWTSPMYSWYPPMYWTSPDILMISPNVLNTSRCTHDIPRCTHDIPQCTEHPRVLMISPRCTHGIPRCTDDVPLFSLTPPMYWTHIIQGDFDAEVVARLAHWKGYCSYFWNEKPRKIRDIKFFILLKFAEIWKSISLDEKWFILIKFDF